MRFLQLRQYTALFLSAILFSSGSRVASAEQTSLQEALRRPYLDIFELAQTTQYRAADVDSVRGSLKNGQEICISRLRMARIDRRGRRTPAAQANRAHDRRR